MKQYFFFFLLFILSQNILAQADFKTGLLPKIAISKKISDKTKWSNSIESRTFIYDKTFQFTHSLVELTSLFTFKTFKNQSFSIGYLARFRDGNVIHRAIQQYNFSNKFSSFKLGHRFGFEQFYQVDKKRYFRTRYRASIEKPLKGTSVDVKEFYLKFGNEYLYNSKAEDLEIRFAPFLGFKASENDKIEFGLDYRLSDFIDNQTENQFWIRATWAISI